MTTSERVGTTPRLPFEGLRVIEVASFVAAPAAATMFADLGASVIKIEAPGLGDPWRYQYSRPGLPKSDANYLWHLTGRNKRSLGLDLKAEAGQAVMHRLIESADVFITNLPLRARDRLGISYDVLSKANPRLVYGSLSGYGEIGDESEEKAYDTTVWWGRSGLMEQFRADPEGAPVRAPIAMGDHATALAFFGSIAAGLFQREATGKGAYLGTSLLAAGTWVNGCLVQAGLAGAEFAPKPARTDTANPLQCHYRCADDRWIIIIVGYEATPTNWERLVRCLGMPELLHDDRFQSYESRAQHCTALIGLMDEAFRRKPSHEWVGLVRKAGLPIEVLNSPTDAANDEQLKRAQIVVPFEGDVGMSHTVSSPHWFRDVPKVKGRRGPDLGEHTVEILDELGFAQAEIDELLRGGAFQCLAARSDIELPLPYPPGEA